MVFKSGNILTPTLRNQLLAIKSVQRGVDVTTLRLATGLKVNSALDNPQNFFQAQSLVNRASDLSRILDGLDKSIRTVEEAIHGTKALEKLLDQAEALANETKTELASGLDFPDLSFVEEEFTDISRTPLSQQINADAPVAYYRLNDLAGVVAAESTGTAGVSDGTYQGVTLAQSALYSNEGDVSADFNGSGRVRIPDSALINTGSFAERTVELVFNADDIINRQILYEEGAGVNGFTIYIDNGLVRVTAEDDAGGNTFADIDISAPIVAGQTYHVAFTFNRNDQTFRGYLDGTEIGQAAVFNENFPSHSGDIGIGGMNGGAQFHDGEDGGNNGYNFNGRISDVAIYNRALSGAELFSHADALEVDESINYIHTRYDEVLAQIDAIIEDAGFRGVNLLKDEDLVTDFNEDRSNFLVTEGIDFSYEGLGLKRFDFNDEDDIDDILDSVRQAREAVRNYGRSLATDFSIIKIREDFTRETISVLQNGADDLTVADQNEEGANLLALQTRQTIGTSVLALNQASIADFLL